MTNTEHTLTGHINAVTVMVPFVLTTGYQRSIAAQNLTQVILKSSKIATMFESEDRQKDRTLKIVILFIFSTIMARLLAVVFPSVSFSGLSTESGTQVSMYGISIYGPNPDLILKLIAIVQYEAYAVIPIVALTTVLLARLKESGSFESVGPSSNQMRNGYIIIGLWVGVPLFPIVLIGVFGVKLFGITFVPSFLPSDLHQNFAVLSAPIFLLSVLVSTITGKLARRFKESHGA